MNTLVEAVSAAVARECRARKCKKEGCSVSMNGAPAARVIVDLDCGALQLDDRKRCDYLFVGGEGKRTWVAPMELKSGGFRADDVVEQLDGGAAAADKWIPAGGSFVFVPVLAHGKGVRKKDRDRLRDARVTLRNRTRQIVLLHCGQPLGRALDVT